jgi:hypothetical protein
VTGHGTLIGLDTDVASSIIKQRLSASLAGKLIGRQEAITFVTIGELIRWPVVRNLGMTGRTTPGRGVAVRPPIPFAEEVARTWAGLSGTRTRAAAYGQ